MIAKCQIPRVATAPLGMTAVGFLRGQSMQ